MKTAELARDILVAMLANKPIQSMVSYAETGLEEPEVKMARVASKAAAEIVKSCGCEQPLTLKQCASFGFRPGAKVLYGGKPYILAYKRGEYWTGVNAYDNLAEGAMPCRSFLETDLVLSNEGP